MRVETIKNATLYLGNCREILPAIAQIDALISDPPYGIDLAGMCGTYRDKWSPSGDNSQRQGMPVIHGDDKRFDPTHLLNYHKVILFGGVHFCHSLPEARAWLVWDKRDGGDSDNQADCEMAWSNLPGPARLYSQKWRGLVRAGEENVSRQGRCHPTQKPVALMQWCIEMARLKQNDVICDPYMGSGTTGMAAARAGHPFIGCEIDERHFETALERITNEHRQSRLFV